MHFFFIKATLSLVHGVIVGWLGETAVTRNTRYNSTYTH